EFVFATASLDVVEGGSCLGGLPLGRSDELLGEHFHLWQEILMPDFQPAADPPVHRTGVPKREVACENDAVETGQLVTNIRLPLLGKLLTENHGGVPCECGGLKYPSITARNAVSSSHQRLAGHRCGA